MHIFIDESGPFVPPTNGLSMCCVCTLAIPESCLESVFTVFRRTTQPWVKPGIEPKGSLLGERQFDRLITLLSNYDVVLTILAIEMGLHTDQAITHHKMGQAQRLRASVEGPEFFESFRADVHDLANRVAQLSNQLYVQSVMLTGTVERTLQTTTAHFAQTDPATLGSFRWRIDAKDKTIQESEQLWVDLIKPLLQSRSMTKPLVTVSGSPAFDYSALAPFENPVLDEPPKHLQAARMTGAEGPFHSIDTRKIVADLSFADSRSNPGLQLIDILASAFRRACNGRLGEKGWRRLGSLTVQNVTDKQAVGYVSLQRTRPHIPLRRMPYWNVVSRIESTARKWEVQRDRPS